MSRKGMKYRPLEVRIKLYNEVHRLRKLRLSHRRIIREIERRYGIILSRSHVEYWLKGRDPRRRFNLLPGEIKASKELAYILGVVAGDGYTQAWGRQRIIALTTKDVEFAMEFKRCLEIVGKCKPMIRLRYGRYYEVKANSSALYDLCKKPLDLERLRKYIEYNEKTIISFLRGFFDAEGHVSKAYGYIYLCNSDLQLLNYVKQLLLKIRIEASGPHLSIRKGTPFYCKKNGKTYFRDGDKYLLYIKANSRQRFAKVIGFTIKRKMERLFPSPNFYLVLLNIVT